VGFIVFLVSFKTNRMCFFSNPGYPAVALADMFNSPLWVALCFTSGLGAGS